MRCWPVGSWVVRFPPNCQRQHTPPTSTVHDFLYFIIFHNSPACAVARRGSWVVSSIAPSLHLLKNDAIHCSSYCNQLSVDPPHLRKSDLGDVSPGPSRSHILSLSSSYSDPGSCGILCVLADASAGAPDPRKPLNLTI